MKAYKQIDLQSEKKAVALVVSGLVLICLMILISPVFAEVHSPGMLLNQPQLTPFQNKELSVEKPAKDFDLQKQFSRMNPISLAMIFNQYKSEVDFNDTVSRFIYMYGIKWFKLGYLNGLFYCNQSLKSYGFYNIPIDSTNSKDSVNYDEQQAYLDFVNRYSLYLAEHRELIRKYFREGI